jgi:hypothetical protein
MSLPNSRSLVSQTSAALRSRPPPSSPWWGKDCRLAFGAVKVRSICRACGAGPDLLGGLLSSMSILDKYADSGFIVPFQTVNDGPLDGKGSSLNLIGCWHIRQLLPFAIPPAVAGRPRWRAGCPAPACDATLTLSNPPPPTRGTFDRLRRVPLLLCRFSAPASVVRRCAATPAFPAVPVVGADWLRLIFVSLFILGFLAAVVYAMKKLSTTNQP